MQVYYEEFCEEVLGFVNLSPEERNIALKGEIAKAAEVMARFNGHGCISQREAAKLRALAYMTDKAGVTDSEIALLKKAVDLDREFIR